MEKEETTNKDNIDKILDLYFLTNKLKGVLRQGWLNWGVSNARVESIAEHIYGTIMLATSIFANITVNIDLNKVALMLALHETEELIIGDLTPFDIEKNKTKRQDGKIAVEQVFKESENKIYFLELIEEFEKRESIEAKFAFQCDKLEADLQAFLYEGHYNIDKTPNNIKSDERIVTLQKQGFNKVSQFFTQNDRPGFSGIFADLAERLIKRENDL